jgi:hypothetical protein
MACQKPKCSLIAEDAEKYICCRCNHGADPNGDIWLLRRIKFQNSIRTVCVFCMENNNLYYKDAKVLYIIESHNRHTPCDKCRKVKTLKFPRVWNYGLRYDVYDWYCEFCYPTIYERGIRTNL